MAEDRRVVVAVQNRISRENGVSQRQRIRLTANNAVERTVRTFLRLSITNLRYILSSFIRQADKPHHVTQRQ